MIGSRAVAAGVGLAAVLLLGVGALTTERLRQAGFPNAAVSARVPVVREDLYTVNARVRPLLLFWIGRDDIGQARVTRREASGGRQVFELLIGSDPARAPRQINRWGFIVEDLSPEQAEILGVMKESNEKTMEEAEAQIAQSSSVSTFKAARTTVAGRRAVTGAMTVRAPADLTYRDLDALLALLPERTDLRTIELPAGTQRGFLVAMDSLIRASAGPCGSPTGGAAGHVPPVSYLYNATIYDLSLLSCEYEPSFRIRTDTYADVAGGDFQIRNRTTNNKTKFRIFYGTSGEWRDIPVRAVFRPRWWMEIELVLDRPATHNQTA